MAPILLIGVCKTGHDPMTVQQLIDALRTFPADATVLLEGDAGYAPLGALALQPNDGVLPDELILSPDMTPD